MRLQELEKLQPKKLQEAEPSASTASSPPGSSSAGTSAQSSGSQKVPHQGGWLSLKWNPFSAFPGSTPPQNQQQPLTPEQEAKLARARLESQVIGGSLSCKKRANLTFMLSNESCSDSPEILTHVFNCHKQVLREMGPPPSPPRPPKGLYLHGSVGSGESYPPSS